MRDLANILRGLVVAPIAIVLCAALVVFTDDQRKPWRHSDG